jgi:hypothetical protein
MMYDQKASRGDQPGGLLVDYGEDMLPTVANDWV